MAGFKLMKNSPYMNLVQEGTLITNLNQGAGVPTFWRIKHYKNLYNH